MTDLNSLLVSHSRLGTLDSCEMKYYFGYELGWKAKEKSTALSLGSAVHELLATHYSARLLTGRKSNDPVLVQLAKEAVQETVAKSSSYDSLDILRRAGTLFLRYIEDYAPKQDATWEPVVIEQHFQMEITDMNGVPFEIQGYVDVLMKNLRDGTLWIWDHKSVGQGKFWTPTDVSVDAQLPTYWFILDELGYDIKGICYNMLNTYDYKKQPEPDKLFRREYSHRTDTELLGILDNVRMHVTRLREIEASPFRKRSMSKDKCSWCQFLDPCQMALKGVDPAPILQAHFYQEEKDDEPTTPDSNENRPII